MTTIAAILVGYAVVIAALWLIGDLLPGGKAYEFVSMLFCIAVLPVIVCIGLPINLAVWLYLKANPQEATQTVSTYTPLGEFEIDRNDE